MTHLAPSVAERELDLPEERDVLPDAQGHGLEDDLVVHAVAGEQASLADPRQVDREGEQRRQRDDDDGRSVEGDGEVLGRDGVGERGRVERAGGRAGEPGRLDVGDLVAEADPHAIDRRAVLPGDAERDELRARADDDVLRLAGGDDIASVADLEPHPRAEGPRIARPSLRSSCPAHSNRVPPKVVSPKCPPSATPVTIPVGPVSGGTVTHGTRTDGSCGCVSMNGSRTTAAATPAARRSPTAAASARSTCAAIGGRADGSIVKPRGTRTSNGAGSRSVHSSSRSAAGPTGKIAWSNDAVSNAASVNTASVNARNVRSTPRTPYSPVDAYIQALSPRLTNGTRGGRASPSPVSAAGGNESPPISRDDTSSPSRRAVARRPPPPCRPTTS